MSDETKWVVVVKTAKGKTLVRSTRTYATEEEAKAAVPEEKTRLLAWSARRPAIVVDDDGLADDLYDVLQSPGIQFEAAVRE